MLTDDQCYQAVQGRDRRFDGMFFTAVHSTGIFCRPSCPARTPLRVNVSFYRSAAAAAEAGFRACKRCRPDASPGSPDWDIRADVTGRALRLIRDGLVDREGIPALASAVGYSSRQLGRVLHAEIGAGPLALARQERARTARTLIESTRLTMAEIAFAAGFTSIRQFNDTVAEVYGLTPSRLRKLAKPITTADGLVLRLAYRAPLDLGQLFAYFASRAVPGIEDADGDHYIRSLRLAHGPAVIELRAGRGDFIECHLHLSDTRDLGSAVSRARRLFDLDADPVAIASTLTAAGWGSLVQAHPGVRSPGHSDPVELAVRTVLGQQISVAAAGTHLARLVAGHGEELPEDLRRGGVDRLFPTAEAIMQVSDWALPARRIASLRALAEALHTGAVELGPGCDRDAAAAGLLALPGIGPWSVGYIRMRALGDPDVQLDTDLGVKKALADLGPEVPDEGWARAAPWRSYLTHLLWAQHSLQSHTATARTRTPRTMTEKRERDDNGHHDTITAR